MAKVFEGGRVWMASAVGYASGAVAVCLALAVAGCHGPDLPPLPPANTQPSIAPGPYVLKVGDLLDIRFYKTPELNAEVPVRSDGKISLELVGDVQAAGLEPDALSKRLGEMYAHELTNPRVTVIVRSFGGAVFVGGEVTRPSAQAFAYGMTALQAINGAGGFATTAKVSNVILIRREEGQFKGHLLALDRAISGEDPTRDIPLEPGDILHVPRTAIADANLFVEKYIRNMLPIQPGLSIPVF
jgi:polysaccharide biosynthesis/export protein